MLPGDQRYGHRSASTRRSYSPRLQIYVSPVNIDPAQPELPISNPAGYSRELAEAIGPFYTQGIAEDTAALRQGVFDLPEYLDQSRKVTDEQLALLRYAVRALSRAACSFNICSASIRTRICFGAKHEPELLETYQRIDEAIGWVRTTRADATLIVMSDHGFAAFDRAFHLNTWLYREGFLSLRRSIQHRPRRAVCTRRLVEDAGVCAWA